MSSITSKTSIAELGALICGALKKEGIDAFLSGGAVVSIYTHNKYESFDLDFISLADRRKIKQVMEGLGFVQDQGRLFAHPKSKYSVEFPGSAVQVGDSLITTVQRGEILDRNVETADSDGLCKGSTGGILSLERSSRPRSSGLGSAGSARETL